MRWWHGTWITVHEDRSWDFHCCAVCGTPLSDSASRRRGYGPDCALKFRPGGLTPDEWVLRRREQDRLRYRREVVTLGFSVGVGERLERGVDGVARYVTGPTAA